MIANRDLFNISAKATLIGAALAFAVPSASHACSCGTLPDGLTAMHPRSIEVAFAVRDAIDAGLLARPDAPAENNKVSAAASLRMSVLYRALADAIGRSDASTPIALLLIDSGAIHEEGPNKDGRAIIVTHGSVLTAVMAGGIEPQAAFDRGLIVIDAGPEVAAAIRQSLIAALAPDEE